MNTQIEEDKIIVKNNLEKCERGNDHELEVWVNESKVAVKIKPGSEAELDFDRSSDDIKLHIKTKVIPSKNGVKGVKIIPGWYPCGFHHVDTLIKGSKLHLVLHYYLKKGNKKEDKNHKDPTVVHPDEPGGS